MGIRFKSKVDAWIGIVLAGCALLSAASAVIVFRSGVPLVLVAVIVTAGTALPVSLLLRTDYTVENAVLIVRTGLFRWRIPLTDIASIGSTRNPMSSPALSLDRLLIERRTGSDLMISPLDKKGFLQELQKRGVEAAGSAMPDQRRV
jgi:membrane protein YdbS with pleckstrin-like domain